MSYLRLIPGQWLGRRYVGMFLDLSLDVEALVQHTDEHDGVREEEKARRGRSGFDR